VVKSFLGSEPELHAKVDPMQLPEPLAAITIVQGLDDEVMPVAVARSYCAAFPKSQQRARRRRSELALSRDCARPGPLARFAFILSIPSILAKNSTDAEHQTWPCQRYSNGLNERNLSQDGGDGQDKYDG
jgi:hypothetical protein